MPSAESTPVTTNTQAPSPWDLVLMVLSILSVVLVALVALKWTSPDVRHVLVVFDDALCVIFLADAATRFYRSENRLKWLQTGWIDVISSIPTIEALRFGRAFRVFRLLRIYRGVWGTQLLIRWWATRRADFAAAGSVLFLFVLIGYGALAVLIAERGQGSIDTIEDAIWWAFVTATTVGYGDFAPVTPPGRLVGVVLMLSSIGLFGTISGFMASKFVDSENDSRDEQIQDLIDEVRRLQRSIEKNQVLGSEPDE